MPTFARGIEQNADAPALAVSKSLSTIRLDVPSIPPLSYQPQVGNSPEKPDRSASDQSPSVVFQNGAISIAVSGATPT